jgi:hypothetical protein
MNTDFPTEITPRTAFIVEFEWVESVESTGDYEVSLKICDQIEKLKVPTGVYTTDRHQGPCWGHWRHIEGDNIKKVKEYAEKILRLLKRRGCRVELF